MKISFIIAAHNEEFMIGSCLASIEQALAATPCDAEIIVVDNASTDRTAEIAASFQGVRVVPEPHKGIVWARRAGFLASQGDLVANLDADTIMPAEWLPYVLHTFESDPSLQGLSGPYIFYDAAWSIRATMRLFYYYWFIIDLIIDLLFKSGSMFQGGNFILRRAALEKAGGFDTSIEFYGEDTDIGRRVRKVGKVIWTFKLPMYSSGRRWAHLTDGTIYMVNYIWLFVFGKPFTKRHADIRIPLRTTLRPFVPAAVTVSSPGIPTISIIIPTLQEEKFLERTLASLKSLSLPHEIIITDGGSTDATLEIARRYTDKIVVWSEPRRQTFGEAKNAGAALASGGYVIFIDADVLIAEPDAFFKKLLAEFARHPKLVAMTVSLLPWLDNVSRRRDEIFCAPLNIWYIISNNIFRYGNASGEFQMFRHTAFSTVGGYREDLAGGEDTDMFNRVSKIGQTRAHWRLSVRHSCRRAHKTGWFKLYYMWARQGFSVLLLSRTAYKEWTVVR